MVIAGLMLVQVAPASAAGEQLATCTADLTPSAGIVTSAGLPQPDCVVNFSVTWDTPVATVISSDQIFTGNVGILFCRFEGSDPNCYDASEHATRIVAGQAVTPATVTRTLPAGDWTMWAWHSTVSRWIPSQRMCVPPFWSPCMTPVPADHFVTADAAIGSYTVTVTAP